ncbi:hypothetical protein [Amycolatopsis minnesotensis]|uniref:AAA domain-containing protein n=1 Tax=Amycolatopsis minnesotensis TaxID=337894 RepID=A0ABN2RZU3_9PSEU
MTVYAIGGSSSVGKTTVAERFAARHGIGEVIHVDDLRTHDLTASREHSWLRPEAELLDALLASTARLRATLAAELDRLSALGGSTIIEGEGIEPSLVHQYAHRDCRVVYVVEPGEHVLWTTLATRPSGPRFLALTPREQHGVVRMNHLYGQWLRAAAERHRQPWLSSRPWNTLDHRVNECLSGG